MTFDTLSTLFATEKNLTLGGLPEPTMAGLFYDGTGERLGAAVVGVICITAWVAATMFPFFTILDKMGMSRVDFEVEKAGVDKSEMGGDAYVISPPERELKRNYSMNQKADESPVAATAVDATLEKIETSEA